MAAKDILAANYAALKSHRVTRGAELREQLNAETDVHRREFENLLSRAINDEGMKISEASRIMGCSRQLVYDMLARVDERRNVTHLVDPFASRYQWEGDLLRITLDADELLPSIAKYGWTEPLLKKAVGAGYGTDTFEVAANGAIVPTVHGALATFEFLDRPVTLWVLNNEESITEWVAAHTEGVAA